MRCCQCQLLRINGVVCHETGCPLAYRDERRECRWCGTEFAPEDRGQVYCSPECHSDDCGNGCIPYGDDGPEWDVVGRL